MSASVFITSVCTADPCVNGPMPCREAVLVDVDEQLDVGRFGDPLPERVHLPELPGRVDVQQRERKPARVERLPRQMKQDGAVLADRVEHHRALGLRDRVPQDVDRLGFQPIEIGK